MLGGPAPDDVRPNPPAPLRAFHGLAIADFEVVRHRQHCESFGARERRVAERSHSEIVFISGGATRAWDELRGGHAEDREAPSRRSDALWSCHGAAAPGEPKR